MTGAELNVLLNRVAEGSTPEDRDAAWNAITDEFVELSQWIDPKHLRAIADALPGEKAASLVAYQRGDWGIHAFRPFRVISRASTAAEAIASARDEEVAR